MNSGQSRVYVDEVKEYPVAAIQPAARRYGTKWSHLWTEPGNEAALHELARKIGMARMWFQDKKGFPHYDVVPSRRLKAIAAGAVPMDLTEWVRARMAGNSPVTKAAVSPVKPAQQGVMDFG
jgi:hypothetical protein